jgi:hypothetical protein
MRKVMLHDNHSTFTGTKLISRYARKIRYFVRPPYVGMNLSPIFKLTKKTQKNKTNWLQHVEGLENYRLPKFILN